ncbi:MAG TPA: hypothetical protein VFQ39_02060, partial [Longimicrobium sp.]|nr:hypothetical protein [Longimicrobium sp.]
SNEPVGHAAVDLRWLPPSSWDQEPFRVYGKTASGSTFFLIATVTSCTTDGCTYRDRNVSTGQSYEYYVATVNERTNEETSTEFREAVAVPGYSKPATPAADSVVGLDNATFLRWSHSNEASLSRFLVYLTRLDGTAYLYQMGETDGTGFLDQRAENGHRYGYRIAAVDTLGHVSALSAEMAGVPRPDYTAELVYAFADNAAASGFRFVGDEGSNPILAGNSASAQWRLETDATGWKIVPLNGTSVMEFSGRTTALTCGPGADAGCRAVTRAPVAGYQTTPIAVNSEFSYVFRVNGSDGQPHYGVVRATILGTDQTGRDLLIFDWAYQLIANEPRLNLGN